MGLERQGASTVALKVGRQDYPEPCDHPSRRQCRAKGPDGYGGFWHNRPRWHVWDEEVNDYAAGTGPCEFESARAAREWRDKRAAKTGGGVASHTPSGGSGRSTNQRASSGSAAAQSQR